MGPFFIDYLTSVFSNSHQKHSLSSDKLHHNLLSYLHRIIHIYSYFWTVVIIFISFLIFFVEKFEVG